MQNIYLVADIDNKLLVQLITLREITKWQHVIAQLV